MRDTITFMDFTNSLFGHQPRKLSEPVNDRIKTASRVTTKTQTVSITEQQPKLNTCGKQPRVVVVVAAAVAVAAAAAAVAVVVVIVVVVAAAVAAAAAVVAVAVVVVVVAVAVLGVVTWRFTPSQPVLS